MAVEPDVNTPGARRTPHAREHGDVAAAEWCRPCDGADTGGPLLHEKLQHVEGFVTEFVLAGRLDRDRG